MSRTDSRELGLLAAQQLLGLEDLHYGFWDPDAVPRFADFPAAQERYCAFVLEALDRAMPEPGRILDVGAGTGKLSARMAARGHRVDAVSPSERFARQVRERLGEDATVHPCFLQDLPEDERRRQYDLIFFGESFQYLRLYESFPLIDQLLATDGRVLICDFFKTEHFEDGAPGDKSFGGGRKLHLFRRYVEAFGFEVEREEDITDNVSPNMDLLDEAARRRILPVLEIFDEHLQARRPWLYGLLRRLFRRRWEKLRYRHFEGHRNRETFARYKTYRLFVLRSASRGDTARAARRAGVMDLLAAERDDDRRRRRLARLATGGTGHEELDLELSELAAEELGPES